MQLIKQGIYKYQISYMSRMKYEGLGFSRDTNKITKKAKSVKVESSVLDRNQVGSL